MVLIREENILLGSKNNDIHSSLYLKEVSVSLERLQIKMLIRSAGCIVKKILSKRKSAFGKLQVEMTVTFTYTEFPLMSIFHS